MHTRTIGEMLQAARLRHHWTPEQLAAHTKIRVEYLQALEDNQFTQLPAATFVKGFIRSYASTFSLDAQPLLALLRRDYKESAAGKLVPREFIKPVLKRRAVWTPVTFAIVVLAGIFLSMLGYIGVQWYALQKPPLLEISSPIDQSDSSSDITVEGRTVTDGVVTVNGQPVALQPDGKFQTQLYVPRPGLQIITIEVVNRRGKSQLVQRTVKVNPDQPQATP